MDIIIIFIVWLILPKLLKLVLGTQRQRPYESAPTSKTEEESWSEDDNYEKAAQPLQEKWNEEAAAECTATLSEAKILHEKEEVAQEELSSLSNNLLHKKRKYRNAIAHGLIMAEVLGKPRALRPYGEE